MLPVYDRKGELLGASLFALNINDRKQAEIALKESEEKFRSIVEAAPTPILILDNDLNIVLTNSEVENVFKYSKDELKNQHINILFPKDFISILTKYQKAFKEPHTPYRTETEDYITTVKKDGNELFIEVSLNRIQINNETFILVIVLDVTERIKAEKKIIAQLKKLEAIAWQQSHEVRRPVANILGIINLLKTLPNIKEEEKEEYLSHLYKTAEELDKVIHKIVNSTRE